MAGKRKPPRLRRKEESFVADVYKPDGKRSTVSFGSRGQRTEGQIYSAFGKWLDLFNRHPHKVLAFKDPYEAIARMISPATIVTVGELYDKYVEWAGQFLAPMRDGRAHPEFVRAKRLGKFLEPYREWPISDFGPDELKAIRDRMVAYRYFRTGHDDDPIAYTRTGINQLVNQVHKIWQWGIGWEITTEAQRRRLRQVQPLRLGRCVARDKLKRAPVTDAEFERVTKHLTTVVADMLRLIWFTAMRPSEVCRMRPYDITRDDPECWLYIPGRDASRVGDHKMAHHRRLRAIPLAAKAQAIIGPRMRHADPMKPIFKPADAIREARDRRFALRETPMNQGNRAGTNRQMHPMIKPREGYDSNSLAHAVGRSCKRAGVERFTPYDLRRTAATRVRAMLSKEDARLLLGHVSTDTTEIYLLDEVQEAIKLAKRMDSAGPRRKATQGVSRQKQKGELADCVNG